MITERVIIETQLVCDICGFTALGKRYIHEKQEIELYWKFQNNSICKECYNSNNKNNRKDINSLEIDYFYR